MRLLPHRLIERRKLGGEYEFFTYMVRPNINANFDYIYMQQSMKVLPLWINELLQRFLTQK